MKGVNAGPIYFLQNMESKQKAPGSFIPGASLA